MTMDEVREYERATQEATNRKIGPFPPSISITETPLASVARNGPSSAPSTPLSTEPPEYLSVPKDRPRKKSAPETLTLPDPNRRDSGFRPSHVSSSMPLLMEGGFHSKSHDTWPHSFFPLHGSVVLVPLQKNSPKA
uniref:Uncharacterized protein n=1 Tax=Hucho hucho TaxID=62062 RepID=A0A4W5L2U3_9TELE